MIRCSTKCLSIAICLVGLGLMPAPAHAETMMGKINNFFSAVFDSVLGEAPDPDPTASGIAPFANPDDVKPLTREQIANGTLAVNNSTLDRAHRSSADLEDFLTQSIPEALSFNADTYPLYIAQLLPRGYSASGLQEFQAWIETTKLIPALQGNGLQLNAFVMERPLLMNEGNVNGRYRWLYEIPVMISFVPRGTRVYDEELAVDSRQIIVTLQLGRVQNSVLDSGVVMETWAVRDAPVKN